jgi:hypothetical protein
MKIMKIMVMAKAGEINGSGGVMSNKAKMKWRNENNERSVSA